MRMPTACVGDVIDALRELEMTIVRYPGGNFASRVSLARRRGTEGIEADSPGTGLAVDRAQHLRYGRIRQAMPQTRLAADARGQSRHRLAGRGAGLGRVLQLAERHPIRGRTRRQWQRRALRRADLVPRQRDGRPLATRPCARRPVRHPRPAGGHDDEDLRPVHRHRCLRFLREPDAHVPRVGPSGARTPRRPRRLREPAPLRRQPGRQQRRLSCDLEQHRQADRSRRCLHAPGRRTAARFRQPGMALLRRVERLVPAREAKVVDGARLLRRSWRRSTTSRTPWSSPCS